MDVIFLEDQKSAFALEVPAADRAISAIVDLSGMLGRTARQLKRQRLDWR